MAQDSKAPDVKANVTVEETTNRRTMYPQIAPFETGFLKVTDVHTIYYELCGNPNGKPAIFVHGGPGGGLADYYRQFFDPEAYKIVLFDQRGAGKSTPFACLEENDTWSLVADMEKLREKLQIEKWLVFGGSWGSTLALAYAETHPTRVTAMVMRGIFALRRKELLWFYQEGASFLYPDAFEEFVKPIPVVERGDMMGAYYRRLTGNNEEEKLKCALAWSKWEMTTSRLFVDPKLIERSENAAFALPFARIECHYFVNGGFLQWEDQLIDNAKILQEHNIPATIVQGRYDLVCPMFTAWALHKTFPSAKLVIIPDSGHSPKEPGITSELVKATDNYRSL